jgi:hypothetical protein
VRRDRKNWEEQNGKSDVLGTSPFCTDAGDLECFVVQFCITGTDRGRGPGLSMSRIEYG